MVGNMSICLLIQVNKQIIDFSQYRKPRQTLVKLVVASNGHIFLLSYFSLGVVKSESLGSRDHRKIDFRLQL